MAVRSGRGAIKLAPILLLPLWLLLRGNYLRRLEIRRGYGDCFWVALNHATHAGLRRLTWWHLSGSRRGVGRSLLCQKRLIKGEGRKFSVLANCHFRCADSCCPFHAGD